MDAISGISPRSSSRRDSSPKPAAVPRRLSSPAAAGRAVPQPDGLLLGAWFDLGTVHVSRKATSTLAAVGQQAWEFLVRHARGDWGRYGRIGGVLAHEDELRRPGYTTCDPARQNALAVLRNDGRVVSEYETAAGVGLWIITHLGPGGYTSVLLPGDG